MSQKKRSCLWVLMFMVLLVVPSEKTGAVVYSEVGNTTEVAWMWIPGSGGPRTPIYPTDLCLVPGDDIDALSLGDDYGWFDSLRRDLFALRVGAVGISGDLQARSAAGLPVERDIYIEHMVEVNKVEYPDLIGASVGGETVGGAIDAFDVGVIDQGSWVFFSLAAGSPTLGTSFSPGDVFACQYGVPGSLAVYAYAADVGTPSNIIALSIHDRVSDGLYDPTADYLIYEQDIPADPYVHHYGFNGPVDNLVHEYSGFGLHDNDLICALEHISLPRPEGEAGECVMPEDAYAAAASGLSVVDLGPVLIT